MITYRCDECGCEWVDTEMRVPVGWQKLTIIGSVNAFRQEVYLCKECERRITPLSNLPPESIWKRIRGMFARVGE